MAENIDEMEGLVKLARALSTKISSRHMNTAMPIRSHLTMKIARKLIEMKRVGYPIVNSIGYLSHGPKRKRFNANHGQ